MSLADVSRSPSDTVMVVESRSVVEWTAPDTSGAFQLNVGSHHNGGFHALFADGTVRFITDIRTLTGKNRRAGGEGKPRRNR